jgi:MFS family permease
MLESIRSLCREFYYVLRPEHNHPAVFPSPLNVLHGCMSRTNIPKAYAASFLKNLQFFGPISVPFFVDWLRVDYTRMFILQAWFIFWIFILEIPTGVIADKLGRKISVAMGCILFMADLLFFGLTRNYYLLYVGEFLGAVGMTLVSGADQALLYDSLITLKEENRARLYFSRYEAAGTLGLLVSFPIGSTIAGLGQYPQMIPTTFLISAIALALAAVAYLWMREPPRTKPQEGFIRMGVVGLKTLMVRRNLRAYALNAITISAVTFFVFWFYQPVLRRAGLSIAYLGWIAAGFNLFSTLLLAQVMRLEKLLGVRRLVSLSAFLPGVLFIALGIWHGLPLGIPAIFLLVGCKMVRVPVLNEYINRYIESENRATVISSVSILERAVTFLLYPVVGMLADVSLDYALWFLGIVAIVFATVTRLSDRHLESTPIPVQAGQA